MTLEDLGGFEVVSCRIRERGVVHISCVSTAKLILLNVMPGMDGVETLKNIREIESDTHVPAVL